jgi:tRNA threonylcarbamoyladenosine biosynthesis protein TsaE
MCYIINVIDMTYEVTTTSPLETQGVATRLAKLLSGGETIELVSDLGGGKTTFVQGLASALSYNGRVTSPTFALSNIYRLETELEIHHYDLYRLASGGVVGEELAEDIADPNVITVIEWAGIAGAKLPADRLTVRFTVTGDTDRAINLTAGGPISAQIIKGLAS